jgi:hypothetical protein
MFDNSDNERKNHMDALFDLADKYVEEQIAAGHPFTEGLCSWATHKAEQEIGSAAPLRWRE